jgi:cell division protein FtsN
MTGTARTALAAMLCAIALGCAEPPPPARPTVEPVPAETRAAPPADPASRLVEAATSTEESPDAEDAEPAQFVVHFGAFRDYLAAATYAESLRSGGLFEAKITRAIGGREMVVTDPMDEAEAKAIAESLGGRVLSLESLESMTEKPLVLPGR